MDSRQKSFIIAGLLLATTTAYSYYIRGSSVEPVRPPDLSAVPLELGDWHGEDMLIEQQVRDVLKNDAARMIRFVNSSGEEVVLYLSYWKTQKYGAQPHSPIHCVPGSGWNVASNKTVETGIFDRSTFITISNGETRQAMFFWYEVAGGRVADEMAVKLNLTLSTLLGRAADILFVRLQTIVPREQSTGDAARVMEKFFEDLSVSKRVDFISSRM